MRIFQAIRAIVFASATIAVRADSKSKLVKEFVKAASRKLTEVGQRGQRRLPLTG
jgi:hypothetical protein